MRRISFLMLVVFFSIKAQAFPEMVRHGYTQCTACHVSPAGGGVLNPYGRQLSGELMSTWSAPNEEQFTHTKIGKDLADKGWLFGGDVREIAIHSKDQDGNVDDRQFLMMGDFQTAYQVEHFTGVVSVGQINRPGTGIFYGDFDATEYYGLIKFTDEIGVRAGRFLPAFGIHLPDHTVVVKEMLGEVLPRFQFDTVEASYLSEHWTVLASAAQTVQQTLLLNQETVRSLNVGYAVTDSMRVGGSYWGGAGPSLNRSIYGLNAILGFTAHFYNMTEFDTKFQGPVQGSYALTQLAYEIVKGLTPYLQYQRGADDISNPDTLNESFGLGVHFYPRPHFEFSGEWDRQHAASNWTDMAYLLAHYYF